MARRKKAIVKKVKKTRRKKRKYNRKVPPAPSSDQIVSAVRAEDNREQAAYDRGFQSGLRQPQPGSLEDLQDQHRRAETTVRHLDEAAYLVQLDLLDAAHKAERLTLLVRAKSEGFELPVSK